MKSPAKSPARVDATQPNNTTDKEPADSTLNFAGWNTPAAEVVTQSYPVVSNIADTKYKFTPENIKTLDDNATYTGSVIGDYAKWVSGASASRGSYTATVTLNAAFESGKVDGEVTNFKDKTTEHSWLVKLSNVQLNTNVIGGDLSGTTKISKTGEAADLMGMGKWKGNFYGFDTTPPYAKGTFDAKTGDPLDRNTDYLDIFGAFHADLQPLAQQ